MSQLICCKNGNGIILGADSKAVFFDPRGDVSHMEVNRMMQLSQHTAILSGGAVEGAEMCRALKPFIEDENLDDVQDVYGAALPFLAGEYEKFVRKECEVLPIDPIHHVYFILGGVPTEILSNLSASICSGQRRNFRSSTEMRSHFLLRLPGSWVWSSG